MKTVTYVLLAVFIMGCFSYLASARFRRIDIIVNMDSAPIEILEFGRPLLEDPDHIFSAVKYKNKTNRDIEALAITIIYYDAFNEKEDGFRGITAILLRAGYWQKSIWSIYGEPVFVKTAIAFVNAVRFLDGEVWEADIGDVFRIVEDMPELSFLSEAKMLEQESKEISRKK